MVRHFLTNLKLNEWKRVGIDWKHKKRNIDSKRFFVMTANSSVICLYWDIGKAIFDKQTEEGWEAKVIDKVSKDWIEAFPELNVGPTGVAQI